MKKKPITEFSKSLQCVLRHMCKAIKANPKKIDFGSERWYQEHRWTEAQEAKFKKWFVQYLQMSKSARRDLLSWPGNRCKKDLQQAVGWFCFQYGWSYTKKD